MLPATNDSGQPASKKEEKKGTSFDIEYENLLKQINVMRSKIEGTPCSINQSSMRSQVNRNQNIQTTNFTGVDNIEGLGRVSSRRSMSSKRSNFASLNQPSLDRNESTFSKCDKPQIERLNNLLNGLICDFSKKVADRERRLDRSVINHSNDDEGLTYSLSQSRLHNQTPEEVTPLQSKGRNRKLSPDSSVNFMHISKGQVVKDYPENNKLMKKLSLDCIDPFKSRDEKEIDLLTFSKRGSSINYVSVNKLATITLEDTQTIEFLTPSDLDHVSGKPKKMKETGPFVTPLVDFSSFENDTNRSSCVREMKDQNKDVPHQLHSDKLNQRRMLAKMQKSKSRERGVSSFKNSPFNQESKNSQGKENSNLNTNYMRFMEVKQYQPQLLVPQYSPYGGGLLSPSIVSPAIKHSIEESPKKSKSRRGRQSTSQRVRKNITLSTDERFFKIKRFLDEEEVQVYAPVKVKKLEQKPAKISVQDEAVSVEVLASFGSGGSVKKLTPLVQLDEPKKKRPVSMFISFDSDKNYSSKPSEVKKEKKLKPNSYLVQITQSKTRKSKKIIDRNRVIKEYDMVCAFLTLATET